MGSSGGEDAGHQENDDEYLATVVSIALAQIGISGNDTNQTDLFSSSIGINNSFSSNSRNGVHRHLGPSVQVAFCCQSKDNSLDKRIASFNITLPLVDWGDIARCCVVTAFVGFQPTLSF